MTEAEAPSAAMSATGRLADVAMEGRPCDHRGTMITRIRQRTEPLKHMVVVGPLLVGSTPLFMTSYLWGADHWFRWNTLTDVIALVMTLLVGVVGVYLLPISRFARGVAALPYIALVGWMMMLWAIVWRGGL